MTNHAVSSVKRCAIYTRKSSDEGLDQAFNSLDAQREACRAYIASQKLEGWVLVDGAYDDGGLSGGSLHRPALQRLLKDIEAGLVDVVVVYKIDRLTRSLADFAKLTELFETHQASFVSITQQFNTSTSMGRLTLNVLLSFAQFEREVAGERIRDKIAASKKRGMWMGGYAPLGYFAKERRLYPDSEEVQRVRLIYERYLELGSVRKLQAHLEEQGIRSKLHITDEGKSKGGSVFSRGALYQILKNPIYRGLISHKGKTYKGDHEAIISKELFEAVQAKLNLHGPTNKPHTKRQSNALLAGLLYDDTGDKLLPTQSNKSGRRYRYYASRRIIKGPADPKAFRLPAHELEELVISSLTQQLNNPDWISTNLSALAIPQAKELADRIHLISKGPLLASSTLKEPDQAQQFANLHTEKGANAKDTEAGPIGVTAGQTKTPSPLQLRDLLDQLLTRIDIAKGSLTLAINLDALAHLTNTPEPPKAPSAKINIPASFIRSGRQLRLIIDNTGSTTPEPDPHLIHEIARAHAWFKTLSTGKLPSIAAIARHYKLPVSTVSRRITLAFLSPDITSSILRGTQPPTLTLERLTRACPLPASCEEQKVMLVG